jgi:hypothetical protein
VKGVYICIAPILLKIKIAFYVNAAQDHLITLSNLSVASLMQLIIEDA